jgi:GTP cyclohydrolase IA
MTAPDLSQDVGHPGGNGRARSGGLDEGAAAVVPPAYPPFDFDTVVQGVRLILRGIGEDVDRPGLRDTPDRVARMYRELTEGMRYDPAAVLEVGFDESHDEIIMVRDIPFVGMCEHHLVQFVGHAHLAYIPKENGEITGLSKLARLVDGYARRPQLQERMTAQIADALVTKLEPMAAAVVVEAEHLCISTRGVRKPGTTTVTSAVRGMFKDQLSARMEVLSLLGVSVSGGHGGRR